MKALTRVTCSHNHFTPYPIRTRQFGIAGFGCQPNLFPTVSRKLILAKGTIQTDLLLRTPGLTEDPDQARGRMVLA